MDTDAQPAPTAHHHDYFDVYRVAIEDLHATRDLGQRIDSFYLTILTLLLTADAYEIANARFDQWAPTFATSGVALIGIAVTARWLQGASNLYQIVRYRYKWLREAEKRPEMAGLGANVFTEEYEKIYLPRNNHGKTQAASSSEKDPGARKFRNRTVFLQILCLVIFILIPIIIGAATYYNLHPDVVQAIQRAIP
jgi:hypothetical protein